MTDSKSFFYFFFRFLCNSIKFCDLIFSGRFVILFHFFKQKTKKHTCSSDHGSHWIYMMNRFALCQALSHSSLLLQQDQQIDVMFRQGFSCI